MSEREDTLQQYVSDMLAVERHMMPAFENQSKDERFIQYPKAHHLIKKMEMTNQSHINGLEHHLKNLGGDPASPIKSAVSAALGMAASVIEKMRTDPISKNLRDDYVVLNLAAIGYTMLHTTGQALMDQEIADVAATYLMEYTPLITDINEVIPVVVVGELTDETEMIDPDAAERSIQRTQQAWHGEHVHSGHTHSW